MTLPQVPKGYRINYEHPEMKRSLCPPSDYLLEGEFYSFYYNPKYLIKVEENNMTEASRNFLKSHPIRDAAWLAEQRGRACVSCGSRLGGNDPAHIRTGTDGATAMKPSDKYTNPLCRTCHERQHQIGEKSFWIDVMQRNPIFAMQCVKAYAELEYIKWKEWKEDHNGNL